MKHIFDNEDLTREEMCEIVKNRIDELEYTLDETIGSGYDVARKRANLLQLIETSKKILAVLIPPVEQVGGRLIQ